MLPDYLNREETYILGRKKESIKSINAFFLLIFYLIYERWCIIMDYEERKKSAYERFNSNNLDKEKIIKARSLEEINQAMGSSYSTIESARRNKDIMLQGIEEYGKDIVVYKRRIQFSDFTKAELTNINIEYHKPRDSDSSRKEILEDVSNSVENNGLDVSKDIRYYMNIQFKNIKQKIKIDGTIDDIKGITTTKFQSIGELGASVVKDIDKLLEDYEDELDSIEIEFTELE